MLSWLFLSEVFLLCFSQRLRQPRISAIIGDDNHRCSRLGIAARSCVLRLFRLPPTRSRFQPENLRGDAAFLSGIEQKSCDLCIRLGHAASKVITKMLAQGFRVAPDYFGDVLLPDSATGQRLHSFAHLISGQEDLSSHV